MIPSNIQSIKMFSMVFASSALASVIGGGYVLHETADQLLTCLTMSGLFTLPLLLKAAYTKGQSCTKEMLEDSEILLKLESCIYPAGATLVVGGLTVLDDGFNPYAVSFTINMVAAMVIAKYLIHNKNKRCSLLEEGPQ